MIYYLGYTDVVINNLLNFVAKKGAMFGVVSYESDTVIEYGQN